MPGGVGGALLRQPPIPIRRCLDSDRFAREEGPCEHEAGPVSGQAIAEGHDAGASATGAWHVSGASVSDTCQTPRPSRCIRRHRSQRGGGVEAADGPRWAIGMPDHLSISNVVPPPAFACRDAGSARAGRGSVRRRTGASRAPWRESAVPGARCSPATGGTLIERPRFPAVQAGNSRHAPENRAPARPRASDNAKQPTSPSRSRPGHPQRANKTTSHPRAAGKPASLPRASRSLKGICG